MNLIDKICNEKNLEEILLKFTKQKKDNEIKIVLESISKDASINEITKMQICKKIFEYVNGINEIVKNNIKEIFICGIEETIKYLNEGEKRWRVQES